MKKKIKFDKYRYYENSVQDPDEHVYIFDRIYNKIHGKKVLSLREDFCGTFLISQAWVKSDSKRKAIALDLDHEPTDYGIQHHFRKLKPDQKRRLKVLNQDVCVPMPKKRVDLICACNFSFNTFKTRSLMKKYLKAALASLSKEGIHVLELAGGPGFIRTYREQRSYDVKGLGKYVYYWDQKSFDPINSHGVYSIHFKDRNKVMHKDCFVYDWRVWSIPELRELMLETGFKDVVVFWEASNKHGHGTGEYVEMKAGDNAYSWIAFVVGIK